MSVSNNTSANQHYPKEHTLPASQARPFTLSAPPFESDPVASAGIFGFMSGAGAYLMHRHGLLVQKTPPSFGGGRALAVGVVTAALFARLEQVLDKSLPN